MLAGRDILGTAQTGTGKTASFVLPLLHGLGETPGRNRFQALVLAPTRELAAQIAESVRAYGRFERRSVAVVVGGVKPGPQKRALAQGVDIVVATPGRLLDHMATGVARLDAVRMLVLDEADQMLDLGFLPAIRKILTKLPAQRQTALLSATMPKPIRALAQDVLADPARIAVAPVSRPIEQIAQSIIHVEQAAKARTLVGLLREAPVERAIVFTRTKRGADRVCRHLDKAGLAAAAIHGDKTQGQRDRALGAFRKGQVPILVATDIAARGIDVDDVSHVVNYDLPNVPESYVHRIGRTARAGKSGIAISLCGEPELGLLRDIERLIGKRISAEGEPAQPRDVPSSPPKAPKKPRASKSAKSPSRKRSKRVDTASGREGGTRGRPQKVRRNRKGGGEAGPDGHGTGLSRFLGVA